MGFDLNKEEVLEIYLKQGKRFLEKLKEAKIFLSKCPQKTLGLTEKYLTILSLLKECNGFISTIYEIGLSKELKAPEAVVYVYTSVDETYAWLEVIEEMLNHLIDILEIRLRPKLDLSEKIFLKGLREDLENLKKEDLSEIILKNLEKAIEKLEESDYLPCSVISSRVTLWMLDKIKGEDEKKDEDKDESKVRKLVKLGIVDNKEISKQIQKSFLEMSRSARNFLLHDMSAFPNCSEANKFLSSALIMAKLYLKYEKIEKSKN